MNSLKNQNRLAHYFSSEYLYYKLGITAGSMGNVKLYDESTMMPFCVILVWNFIF